MTFSQDFTKKSLYIKHWLIVVDPSKFLLLISSVLMRFSSLHPKKTILELKLSWDSQDQDYDTGYKLMIKVFKHV